MKSDPSERLVRVPGWRRGERREARAPCANQYTCDGAPPVNDTIAMARSPNITLTKTGGWLASTWLNSRNLKAWKIKSHVYYYICYFLFLISFRFYLSRFVYCAIVVGGLTVRLIVLQTWEPSLRSYAILPVLSLRKAWDRWALPRDELTRASTLETDPQTVYSTLYFEG